MGRRTSLKHLDLEGNQLAAPSPEVVLQGASTILAFLRAQSENG